MKDSGSCSQMTPSCKSPIVRQNCIEIIRKENALNGSLETSAISDIRLVVSLRTATLVFKKKNFVQKKQNQICLEPACQYAVAMAILNVESIGISKCQKGCQIDTELREVLNRHVPFAIKD